MPRSNLGKMHMRSYYHTSFLFLLAALVGCVNVTTGDLASKTLSVNLGETVVQVLEHGAGNRDFTMINLHDNENTSVEAAMEFVEAKGGRLIQLVHDGGRNIKFDLGGVIYEFDPNRMFTRPGLVKSMEEFGPSSEPALEAVEELRDLLLSAIDIDNRQHVVAIHNNTNLNYSVISYSDNHDLVREAYRYRIKEKQDPDNFFFVTDPNLYDVLWLGNYNLVQQNNEMMTDDGSLSVYCAQMDKSYVNVEVEHGNIEENLQMLYYLGTIID